tara:strand:+ start:11823 stop:12515 length:693 start_codon:yes stop_codon:yes gene_type:complete
MIYNNTNFVETYNHANGKGAENLALNEFSKLLGTNKAIVIAALMDAGIKVPREVSNEGIVKLIRRNRNNPMLKKSLGAIILASTDTDDKYHNFQAIFKKKDGTPRKFNLGKLFKKKENSDPNKKGLGARISGLFKKKGEDGKSPAGTWYNKNKESISNIGNSLLSGLGKGNNSANVVQASDYHSENGTPPTNNGDKKPPMSMMTKIGIGVAVLGVIALVVWKMRGKKGRR